MWRNDSGASTALWTLHERDTDFVLTAAFGGKEAKVEQLAHASDGTGSWLGGIAGAAVPLLLGFLAGAAGIAATMWVLLLAPVALLALTSERF